MRSNPDTTCEQPEEHGEACEDAGAIISRPNTATILGGSIPRMLWRLAVPTWFAFVCLNMMGIIDMLFVGRLGATSVAAVGMGGIMIGFIIMLAVGVGMGTTALVANAVGRGDGGYADLVTSQAVSMGIILSILLAALVLPLAPEIIRAMGAEPDVVEDGAAYLRIVVVGSYALLVHMALAAALRGAGDAMTPMKAVIIAIIVNLILDPIMIYGLFGFPALGVAGSALATVIGRTVGMFLLLVTLLGRRESVLAVHLSLMWPRFDIFMSIFRIGIFATGRGMLHNISRLALMRLAAMFGTPAIAAFGIAFRLQMLILGPGRGFGTAAAAMVGQNLGGGQPERAERSGWIAAGFAFMIGVLFTIGFWIAPSSLIRIFNNDPAVVTAGASLLTWFAASFSLLLVGAVLREAMTGAGDSLRPMIISGISEVLIALPLSAFLAFQLKNATGIWIGFFAGNTLMGLLSAAAFKKGRWRTVKVDTGVANKTGADRRRGEQLSK